MLLSRNHREATQVDKQMSASSTVKIDLNSQCNDATREQNKVNAAGTDINGHKIIAPESQMGQVYQKTNLALHKRGLRSSFKQQKVGSPRGEAAGPSRFGLGVTMTNFNSKLNFDKEVKLNSQGKQIAYRTSRDKPQHRQRMRNTRQKLQTHNQNMFQNMTATRNSQNFRHLDNASSSAACEECAGLRSSADMQEQNNILGYTMPSQTQFLISTIENINAVNNQMIRANQQNKDKIIAAVSNQPHRNSTSGVAPIFSPSEHQFVIE